MVIEMYYMDLIKRHFQVKSKYYEKNNQPSVESESITKYKVWAFTAVAKLSNNI